MKVLPYIIFSILGAGLTACSSFYIESVNTIPNSAVSGTLERNAEMDSLIAPYTRTINATMGKVIGECKIEMIAQRPSSNLGNWTCDLLLQFGKDSLGLAEEPVISLYNVGGLRAAITVGPITNGTIFQVMPFDNVVVAVKIPVGVLPEMLAYLKAKGGEPIGGFKIIAGEMILPDDVEKRGYVWIVTSDFLMNGGDNMTFLGKYTEKKECSKTIRNVLFDGVAKTPTLEIIAEERITF
jgi:2',3'-cyclic-nucleotide 2'-phosphodiesterase (5'-nucleotidase family)